MIGLILLLIPLIAAILVLVGPKKYSAPFAVALSLFPLGASVIAYFHFMQNGGADFTLDLPWISRPNIHFRIVMDGIALLMIGLTGITIPLILLSAANSNYNRPRSFFFLILLTQFALTGVFLADDAVLYYVFWELTLIPTYFILLYWGGENRAPVTFKFFVYTLMGSLFMMLAFIWMYQRGAGLQLSSGNMSSVAIALSEQRWIFAAFMLAFAIKLPLVPFHTWQADTYHVAPPQGAMILSGLLAKMALFSMVRWMLPSVPDAVELYRPLVIIICVIGVIYGAVIAIRQTDLKRLIAYSSLSHIALMVAGIFSLTQVGMEAAFVQAFAHGINTVGLFACAGILQSRLGTTDLSQMGGIRTAAPKFATAFFVIMFAVIALPFTNSFVGEITLLYGVFQYNAVLAAVAALSLVLGAVYMMRMFRLAMLGETNGVTQNFRDLSASEKWVLFPVVILIFAFGIFYKPLFDLTGPVVGSLLGVINMN